MINKKKSTSSCSRFIVNDKITSDKMEISNGFNSFFINVGPTLAAKIPSDNRSPTAFMKDRVINSMVLDNVFSDEIINIIKSLKEGSSGWDGIRCSIIKSTYTAFIEPLS